MADADEITRLLHDWRGGSEQALDDLVGLVYSDLRRLAARRLRAEQAGHTFSAGDLVHEAYGRLVDADIEWQDRVHFFAVAARTMRRVLIDHARAKQRLKRGSDAVRVTLGEDLAMPADDTLLGLDEALRRLAEVDARKAEALELHYFGGLTYDELAAALDVSPATVQRDLRMGKAWLKRELAAGGV